jgi:hypothetical protein
MKNTTEDSVGARKAETEQLRQEFTALAAQWRLETQHLSQISKKVLHPAYLRISGMGSPVLPLLLAELRERPAHWFVALRAIANTDPARTATNPEEARQAWLKWGRTL